MFTPCSTYTTNENTKVAQAAVQGGISMTKTLDPNERFEYSKRWTIMQGLFFATTVLTTIVKYLLHSIDFLDARNWHIMPLHHRMSTKNSAVQDEFSEQAHKR